VDICFMCAPRWQITKTAGLWAGPSNVPFSAQLDHFRGITPSGFTDISTQVELQRERLSAFLFLLNLSTFEGTRQCFHRQGTE